MTEQQRTRLTALLRENEFQPTRLPVNLPRNSWELRDDERLAHWIIYIDPVEWLVADQNSDSHHAGVYSPEDFAQLCKIVSILGKQGEINNV